MSGASLWSAGGGSTPNRIRPGILWTGGNPLGLTTPGTSRVITAQPGTLIFNGPASTDGPFAVTLEAAGSPATLAAANASQPRIDLIYAKMDFASGVGVATLDVVAGTAAASPVRPALPTSSTVACVSIGTIDVPASAGASNVQQSHIRLDQTAATSPDCGYAAGPGGVVVVPSAAVAAGVNGLIEGTPFYALDVDKLGIRTSAGVEMYRKDFLASWNIATDTSSAGGAITLVHNLGVTPTCVLTQIRGGAAALPAIAKLSENGSNTTQTQFILIRTDTAVPIASNFVEFYYLALGPQ